MRVEASCHKESDLQQALCRWYQGEPGASLLELEWRCLERVLSGCFGYYLVQLGCLGEQSVHLRASRIGAQFIVGGAGSAQGTLSGVQGQFHQLPLANASVDLVVLPHTLDFAEQPQQVLREVERILIPGGRVVLLGFSPVSLWGAWRLFRRRSGRLPWCGRFYSRRRIEDWLNLLGFQVESREGLMYRPPLAHAGLLQRLQWLERAGARAGKLLAGVYLLQAVKQESTLTPIRPNWKIRRRSLGARVVEPTARNAK